MYSENGTINVVYHSSDLFASVLCVSLSSLFENNKNIETMQVFIIEHNISSTNKNKLLELTAGYGRMLQFIPMPDIRSKYCLKIVELKSSSNVWRYDSYCRLFLGTLLPSAIDKVLYLDSDTIINASIYELWNTDLHDNYVAAVKDTIMSEYYKLLGINLTGHYCNGGVLLFDLNKWRQDNMEDKIVEYVNLRNGYVFYMEQTVINVVCDGKIEILPPKYNAMTPIFCFSYKNILRQYKPWDWYSEQEISDAVKYPVIIHFTSSVFVINRPWQEKCNHPMVKLFLKYRKYVPWMKDKLSPDVRGPNIKIIHFIISLLPDYLLCIMIGAVRKWVRPFYIRRQKMRFIR